MPQPSQPIPIRIRPATPADIDDLLRINEEAFAPGIVNRLMYPNGLSDDAKAKRVSFFAKVFETVGPVGGAGHTSEPIAYENFVIAAETVPPGDSDKPETIAFARFEVYRKSRPEDEWNVDEPLTAMLVEGANNEVIEAFMGGIRDMRRRNMRGDPGICLRTLVCDPNRARLGAGSALLSWGAELADREGLPTWLEASPQGYWLYRRFGFEDVDLLDLEVKRWGAVRSDDDDWGANCAVERFGVTPMGVYRSVGMRRPVTKG